MRPLPAPLGVISITVLLAACAGGTASPPADTADATTSGASATSSASAEPTDDDAHSSQEPSTATVCPNPHGGACLGELGAGTYSTQVFHTALDYTVDDGWANFEDMSGNFLLVPPTGSLEGVDAGTSDYVSVLDGIAVASADCVEEPQSDVDRTPAAMAAWFVAHPGLETTEPAAVTVGGLDGMLVDLWLADDYSGTCPYAEPEGAPIVPMITGVGPAGVHHVAAGEIVTRLYLLAGQRGRVLAIEVSDVPGGADLEELDAVVEDFVFSTQS